MHRDHGNYWTKRTRADNRSLIPIEHGTNLRNIDISRRLAVARLPSMKTKNQSWSTSRSYRHSLIELVPRAAYMPPSLHNNPPVVPCARWLDPSFSHSCMVFYGRRSFGTNWLIEARQLHSFCMDFSYSWATAKNTFVATVSYHCIYFASWCWTPLRSLFAGTLSSGQSKDILVQIERYAIRLKVECKVFVCISICIIEPVVASELDPNGLYS